MTISEARDFVRQFARNAGDSSIYSDADVDRAVMAAGDYFVQQTQATRTSGTVSLSTSTASFSLSSLTDFRPERVLRAHIAGVTNLAAVGPDELLALQTGYPGETGVPTHVAFTSWAAGEVFPVPTAAAALTLTYVQPMTSWTAGATNVGSTSINLPNDWARQVMAYGAPALLQHNVPEAAYASQSWQKFTVFVGSLRGAGSFGAKRLTRTLGDDYQAGIVRGAR